MNPETLKLLIEIAPSLAQYAGLLRKSDKDGLILLSLIYQRLDDMNKKLDLLIGALPKLLESH
jgi:hypothetical protein